MSKKIRIGLIGSGFSAKLHAEAYMKVYGIEAEIWGIASADDVSSFAKKYNIAKIYESYQKLLQDDAIDVVDICVPNKLHAPFIIEAASAGKHIICEKPLTGCFISRDEHNKNPGQGTYANKALQEAMAMADKISEAVNRNSVKFMYAENWIYAPSVTKAKELLQQSGGVIMDIRAEESHSGSHSAFSKQLKNAGGGSLLILGSHPIAAAIHLKNYEGRIKYGKPVYVESVISDNAQITKIPAFQSEKEHWLVSDWDDVETWANVTLNFSDGTKASIFASFAMLGGIRNVLEIFASNSVIKCNMTPNNACLVYAPNEKIFGDIYLTEKVETRSGWNSAMPDEDYDRGYPQEFQDFMECIAEDREPVSGLPLAYDVVKTVYSAYLSAETGKRVYL